jgi:hypothetical protein
MTLVNETGQGVYYWITCANGSVDCGNIDVDGIADLPGYDNQQNVVVSFTPLSGPDFVINCDTTDTGEQVEMRLAAE